MVKGKFITIEGCEGVGKTTQVKLLREYIEEQNLNFIFLREPGGTEIGEQIRAVLLNKENIKMSSECEALLYAASRVQIIKEVILPALDNGINVICDRYIDSSAAYQGFARGLGTRYIYEINDFAVNYCMPDFTVFLDLNPNESFKRKGGADTDDRLENETMAFHNLVYNGYIEQSKNNKQRFINIQPSGDKYDTHKKIIAALTEKGILKS